MPFIPARGLLPSLVEDIKRIATTLHMWFCNSRIHLKKPHGSHLFFSSMTDFIGGEISSRDTWQSALWWLIVTYSGKYVLIFLSAFIAFSCLLAKWMGNPVLNGAGPFYALLFVNGCTSEPCGCVYMLKKQVSSSLATTFLPLFPYLLDF